MNEQTFVDRRRADWRRLSDLCELASSSPSRLSPDELREFVRLYRQVSTDLAIARTRSTNAPLTDYLNDIAARAYGVLYRAPRKPIFRAIGEAVLASVQTVRRQKVFLMVSALLFFGSSFFTFQTIRLRPEAREYFVAPEMEENFDAWKKGLHEERTSSMSSAMTGFYASNNPRTAIVTAAVGAGTFGVFSVYLLFQNGAILGALAQDMSQVGKLGFLISSIAPHGVPELSGIMVAGSAGLLLGWALINPGRRSRGGALKAVGKDAMTLIVTSVVLMFIAAPIEGFFSFNGAIPQWLKGGVAVVEIAAWTAFWVGYGRTPPSEEKPRRRAGALPTSIG